MSLDPWWVPVAHLDAWQWGAVALLLAWMLLGEPLLGRRSFRRMLARLAAGDPRERVRLYRAWEIQGWVLVALMLELTLLVLPWRLADLGLRWPQLPAFEGGGFLVGLLGGALAGGILAGVALTRGRRPGAEDAPDAGGQIQAMLPRTGAERRAFAVLAVTAGVTEEVIWRGILLAVLHTLLPAWPPAALVAVMALAFGWAHLYQGWRGMLATAVLGGGLALLYLATASVLLPMLLHAAIDLLAMLRGAPARTPTPGDGAG